MRIESLATFAAGGVLALAASAWGQTKEQSRVAVPLVPNMQIATAARLERIAFPIEICPFHVISGSFPNYDVVRYCNIDVPNGAVIRNVVFHIHSQGTLKEPLDRFLCLLQKVDSYFEVDRVDYARPANDSRTRVHLTSGYLQLSPPRQAFLCTLDECKKKKDESNDFYFEIHENYDAGRERPQICVLGGNINDWLVIAGAGGSMINYLEVFFDTAK